MVSKQTLWDIFRDNLAEGFGYGLGISPFVLALYWLIDWHAMLSGICR